MKQLNRLYEKVCTESADSAKKDILKVLSKKYPGLTILNTGGLISVASDKLNIIIGAHALVQDTIDRKFLDKHKSEKVTVSELNVKSKIFKIQLK
jgi:hypothetical protein